MTTKDETLQMALEALQQIHPNYHLMPGRLGTKDALLKVRAAIIACREALAQKDEQEPIGEARAYESTTRYTHCIWDANVVPVGTKLYTAPPERQPLTDAQRYALIEKHLGLEQRKNATVIDHRTGRWTDAARYFDLMDAAIETANGTGEQT